MAGWRLDTGQICPPEAAGATSKEEIGAALRLGGQVGSSAAELVDTLAEADDRTGLPEALIHADMTPATAIPRRNQRRVIIDWSGVGRGPWAWPLAFLLFAAGPLGARRALGRYTGATSMSEEERQRLPGLMIARPPGLHLWSVAPGRMSAKQAIARCPGAPGSSRGGHHGA